MDKELRDSIVDFEKVVNFKLWKYQPGSIAGLVLRDTGVEIFGGKKSSIFVNDSTGIILKGPAAFTGMPNSVQFAGLWRMNNQMLSTIPSTIMSPVTVLDFYMPGQSIMKALTEIAKNIGPWLVAGAAA